MKTQGVFPTNLAPTRRLLLRVRCRNLCSPQLLLALGALSFATPSAPAAVIEAWVQRYNNVLAGSRDEPSKVVIDRVGDVIVSGYTDDGTSGRDILTIKYSRVDGSVIWQRRYDGSAHSGDEGRDLAVDNEGNVVVTASSYNSAYNIDYYTAKYAAADGALLWEQHYDGPARRTDFPRSIAVDRDGNVVVAGASEDAQRNFNFLTVKYAATNGALLWEHRSHSVVDLADQTPDVAIDAVGNILITGSIDGVGGATDYYTAKYAALDGALLWEHQYNGPGNLYDSPRAVTLDGSGNAVVTGSSYSTGGLMTYYTAKYAAADGVLLWERRGPKHFAVAVAVDGNGNVLVTGAIQDYVSGNDSDYYTAKYAAADGALLWEQQYNGLANGEDYVQALAVDGFGNAVVTGKSFNGTNIDYLTIKYAAADGSPVWEKRYDGPAKIADYARAVTVDANGNVVVTGSSYADYHTLKYSAANGEILWEKRYDGIANRSDSSKAVAIDPAGNVVVTGESLNGANYDYYTAKYAAIDGKLLWEKRYNGPANGNDSARALVVDASGNVLITGDSSNGANLDYYTAKYAVEDGSLLWEQRYNGPANSHDYGYAITTDSSGNVIVTGSSYGSAHYLDYYTAKYATGDGSLMWEKRYNGPGNWHDGAQAVATDVGGNVIVTGYSFSGAGNDYYTAKYAAADGALLWEKRYNSPANGDDLARALAVDCSGNVTVTGESWNGSSWDYYTAKYASADGARLWEKRYNGASNSTDHAGAVAVDGRGNVVVTGYSWAGSEYVYYTAKYAAANGDILWEHHGPVGFARAVAVASQDNVVVTGHTQNGINDDYYTAKYAAADGALLWERRYNGPANRNEFLFTPYCLAIGENGSVAITGSSAVYSETYDYATVVYWENLPPLAIDIQSAGVRIRFRGIPGQTYEVQRATGVRGPWETIDGQIAPPSGMIEYYDSNRPNGQGFYRVARTLSRL